MKAVGIHVFAGGFTYGVKKVCDVQQQLEIHNFGRETTEREFGVEFVNRDSWEDWPDVAAAFSYGNPRCTAFSCITKGCNARGAFAPQTKDILDLCLYSLKQRYPVIIWESVQQAWSTGRPLLDKLRDELFVPAGYKIAHTFLNAATFGNVQRRKRYFFVAYKNHLKFNCEVPVDLLKPVSRRVLEPLMGRTVNEGNTFGGKGDHDFDTVHTLHPWEKEALPRLKPHECLNGMGRRDPDLLPPKLRYEWDHRTSWLPFSLHSIKRLDFDRPSPTIHGSAGRFCHPVLDRPLTVGEVATIMGWEGHIPRGPAPMPQIAKGVCPQVGTWLAEQAVACLEDRWDDDVAVDYDDRRGVFVERALEGPHEKVINLTKYTL